MTRHEIYFSSYCVKHGFILPAVNGRCGVTENIYLQIK